MSVVYNGFLKRDSVRDVLVRVISSLCEKDPSVFYLDADLMSSAGTAGWAISHPKSAVNCGIAEANMVGIASGMASEGFKPILHSFGPFASRRVYDQVFLSAAYAKNSITVLGSDPGVVAAFNGGTHMPFEDVALYRAIPDATVIDITDSNMMANVLPQCLELPGVKYLRFGRKVYPQVYGEGTEFTIGKAVEVRAGTDVVIFASGIMVHESMQAAERLAAEGISAAVVNIFTIKPIDVEAIVSYAKATGCVVTAENHNRFGGLYSAVSEVLAENYPVPVECVAVEDQFGEVGPMEYLQERYGLTADKIVEKAKKALKRKA